MVETNYYQQLFEQIDVVYAQLAEALFKNEMVTSLSGSRRVFEFLDDEFPYLAGNVLLIMLFSEFKKYPQNDRSEVVDLISRFVTIINNKKSSVNSSQVRELLLVERTDKMTLEAWLAKMVEGRPPLAGWLSSVSNKNSISDIPANNKYRMVR